MDSEEEEEEEETFSFFFVLPEMNRCIIKRWPHHTKYGRLRVGSGEGGVNTVKGEATKKKGIRSMSREWETKVQRSNERQIRLMMEAKLRAGETRPTIVRFLKNFNMDVSQPTAIISRPLNYYHQGLVAAAGMTIITQGPSMIAYNKGRSYAGTTMFDLFILLRSTQL